MPESESMKRTPFIWLYFVLGGFTFYGEITFADGGKKLNNIVSELLEISEVQPGQNFSFSRLDPGWVFISARCQGTGRVSIILDQELKNEQVITQKVTSAEPVEIMRYVTEGKHHLQIQRVVDLKIQSLSVKAIPELIHCGLGFNSAIKSYGVYDMEFLKRDILPNVTTLIVPHNIELPKDVIEAWHGQGKKFVAEVGINSQATTDEEHARYWTGFYDKAPFLDGIIINEFIINNPAGSSLSPERQKRMEKEQQRYQTYGEAIKKVRANDRYKGKILYAYFGGSGKKLNQEVIGTNFIRTIRDCGYRIALERYLHEMSSENGSKNALQTFVDGIADWKKKEPGVEKNFVIAFGLFSMPPGGINKQPNVDYHVWMDQQMNIVANDPVIEGIDGLEWWTTTQTDEETVRFVGKLYRHYALQGRKDMLTRDPLFLPHIQNADFEKGEEHWTLQAAEPGSIQTNRFPRYGRIEGRYMGLGRPADPEHIGDTFLWMKRSAKRPNTFSQAIQKLEPGRLYSMKMFSCDYQDLINPQTKKLEEANKFIGKVTLEGVELDTKRSFTEMYSSTPEPKIPVWITYHWKVFRAKERTGKLIVSDWADDTAASDKFGQEQTFNFLEIQPYHE
jgi:hypothetical protein